MSNPGRHRSVTLIEAVLFVSIALGVIIAGLAFYKQASLARKVAEMSRLMHSISAEMEAAFRMHGTVGYSHAIDYLIASDSVPPSAIVGNEIQTPWGGAINVTSGSGNVLGFTISGLPFAACVRLLVTDDSGKGLMGPKLFGLEWPMMIGKYHLLDPATGSAYNYGAVTPQLAQDYCSLPHADQVILPYFRYR